MATNVDLERKPNENASGIIRRFSRLSRHNGFSRRLRSRRYFKRKDSELRRKQGALARIEGAKRYEKMRKMGKIG